jgi:ubiquinone/menaquinone biosynthesis C-methylase UbiE
MSDNSGYEYQGLLASSWDFQRGDTSKFNDRQINRDMVERSGEPILDVGCGTGRLLLEYRAEGLDVDGVDNSPEMLAICEQKAAEQGFPVTLYNQEMDSLELPRQYRTILVPSFSFQLVTDVNSAEKTLTHFYNYLLPGGALFMSIWHTKGDGTEKWGDWWLVFEGDGYDGDKTLKRWERSMFNPETQLRHTESRYELYMDGELVYEEKRQRSPELRSYSLEQITEMMEKAGFSGIEVMGFSGEPLSEKENMFCMLGGKS